jgi:dienelactone hydrolase
MQLAKLSPLEIFLLWGMLPIYAAIALINALTVNDLNYLLFAFVAYLLTLITAYLGGALLHCLPFLPRSISPLLASCLVLLLVGVPASLSIAIVVALLSLHLNRRLYSDVRKIIQPRSILLLGVGLSSVGYVSWYLLENSPNFPDTEVVLNKKAEHGLENFYYGSGLDRHRREFGIEADWLSSSFDATEYLRPWSGFSGWYRKHYWGFDSDALPLNGRVTIPEGEGPFPLVLIAHGDHAMQDYSDQGYQYLANSLASQGNVVVSLDLNFLNRSWSSLLMTSTIIGSDEMQTRAQLIVEHIKAWREWSHDPNFILFNKIDFNRMVLIGHSRGGEAAAIAPMLLSTQSVEGVKVNAVIGLAPVYGMYWPQGEANKINGPNYLLIHGSMDGEILFSGRGQYSNTVMSESHSGLKLALYIEGANHGQFNTSWGNNDKEYASVFGSRWNLKGLIEAQDQRNMTLDAISAFLSYSQSGRIEGQLYFTKGGFASRWSDIAQVAIQYAITSTQSLVDFEEGSSAPVNSVGLLASGEYDLGHKARSHFISWSTLQAEEACFVEYGFSEKNVKAASALYIDIASMSKFEEKLTLDLLYTNGEPERSSIKVQPGISRSLSKFDAILGRESTEAVFNSYQVPVDSGRVLRALRVLCPKTPGSMFVDNILIEVSR